MQKWVGPDFPSNGYSLFRSEKKNKFCIANLTYDGVFGTRRSLTRLAVEVWGETDKDKAMGDYST